MPDNHDLHVEVQGDFITLPGTKFMVTYYKVGDPPELRAKSDWTDDPDAPVTLGAFRARAWLAANDKARELGWKYRGRWTAFDVTSRITSENQTYRK
jgi:hypothetical protein